MCQAAISLQDKGPTAAVVGAVGGCIRLGKDEGAPAHAPHSATARRRARSHVAPLPSARESTLFPLQPISVVPDVLWLGMEGFWNVPESATSIYLASYLSLVDHFVPMGFETK